jgi:regulation of enolase protein 1 (concanavalin A-like superfamily)
MERLKWVNEPNGDGSFILSPGRLVLVPPSKRDFWQRTYYNPPLIKDDGPAYLMSQAGSSRVSIEVNLTISRAPGAQFDQAGLMVRIDALHWIKTGIEVVDDVPRLSCVVTNEYSDWSTQTWYSLSLTIRVSQMGDSSYVVEAHDGDKGWVLIRICHLKGASDCPDVRLGLFGCCPVKQSGCVVEFTNFALNTRVSFEHNADDNY